MKKIVIAFDMDGVIVDWYGEVLRHQGFYEAMKPLGDSIDVLNQIYDDDRFYPYLCSSPEVDTPHQICWSEKARWVERYLGKRWLKRMMLVSDKSLANADVIVDDKPDIDGYYIQHGSQSCGRFVFDHPYNTETSGVRVNWDNMIDELEKVWNRKYVSNNITIDYVSNEDIEAVFLKL